MPNRKHTSVVLNEVLQAKLEEECERTQEAKSTVIRRILEQYFRTNMGTMQECGRQIVINIPASTD